MARSKPLLNSVRMQYTERFPQSGLIALLRSSRSFGFRKMSRPLDRSRHLEWAVAGELPPAEFPRSRFQWPDAIAGFHAHGAKPNRWTTLGGFANQGFQAPVAASDRDRALCRQSGKWR